MKSLEELRAFFSQDRYATATTGIEILEAKDGYAKVGLAVHEGVGVLDFRIVLAVPAPDFVRSARNHQPRLVDKGDVVAQGLHAFHVMGR